MYFGYVPQNGKCISLYNHRIYSPVCRWLLAELKYSFNMCYPAPFVLQIILISVKLNEGTDSDILMFFTAECLNRYLLVLSYQSYKNSRYLPDQSLTPAIITIRCTTTSLDRKMMHQRHDNNYSTFWQSVKSKNLRKSYQYLTVLSVTVYLWPFRIFNHSWLLSPFPQERWFWNHFIYLQG